VIVTGAGAAFSIGADVRGILGTEAIVEHGRRSQRQLEQLEQAGKPIIAAINGHCLGGGLQLALVCDYRLASADASIGLPAVKESLIPSMALYRLPRLIGAARARDLILTGDPITAARAEHYGLVDRVVPAVDFSRAVDECIERFLAMPATSVRVSKRLMARAFDLEFDAFRREMESGLRECLASPEHRAAMDEIRRRIKGPP
jgi:enoyl-CoA hydratase